MPGTAPVLDIRGPPGRVPARRRQRRSPRSSGVDLSIARGEIHALVGESGAGKTTVGNALMGLLEAPGRIAAGAIRIAGRRSIPDRPRRGHRARPRHRRDLPGPDDEPQPALHGREPARRDACATISASAAAAGPRARARADAGRRHAGARAPARMPIRTSCPAASASASSSRRRCAAIRSCSSPTSPRRRSTSRCRRRSCKLIRRARG